MGKAILIMVLGSMLLFGMINMNINNNMTTASQSSFDRYNDTEARNVANSIAEMAIAEVGDSNSYRTTSPVSFTNVFGGSGSYTVTDTTIGGQSMIKVRSNSLYDGIAKSVTVIIQVPQNENFPPGVKGAISTNNEVLTSGTLTVDGRDHDLNGNLTGNPGTYGIWSTGDLTRQGSSAIGGYNSGTNYAPSSTPNANSYAEEQPGGYPSTPDSVMGGTPNGFPPGTLKTIAQSGFNGSQYVTNPNYLTYPLSGVTYVEIPSGSSWISSNIDGTGILVIHNSASNAIIKNENIGQFKGILIADDIIHIHTTIIGAIIGLTTHPSEGNSIGNGSGNVLYSRQAIMNAMNSAVDQSNYGYAKHRMSVIKWYE